MNNIISIKDLNKTYDKGRTIALKNINLNIKKGVSISITGPSGSGKSTLLNMIGTLDTPDNGQIIIDGQDVSEIEHINEFRRSKIGFVFQLHNLIPTISARENIEMAMYGTGLSPETMTKKALNLLKMVDMEELASQKPNILSGGERQRVAVARALANNPPIILADEPTGSLDTKNGELILKLLQHHQKKLGATLIIVTHDPTIAQQQDETIKISDGQIDLGTEQS